MRASLRDLFRYAKTGIPYPGMRPFDKLLASQIAGSGFPIATITGAPPLSFESDGSLLTECIISGASGGVGDRTAQIIPYPYDLPTAETSGVLCSFDSSGRITAQGRTTENFTAYICRNIGKLSSGTYTLSVNGKHSGLIVYVRDMTGAKTIASIQSGDNSAKTTFTLEQDSSDNVSVYMTRGSGYDVDCDFTIQLETGSTATDHVPNIYAIPISCGDVTQAIYLSSPLSAGDTASISDTGLKIRPTKGSNTLSVGTTVQPSSVSITGHIQPTT